MREAMLRLYFRMIWHLFAWAGGQMFEWCSLYAPDHVVKGITFANDERYIDAVRKIELPAADEQEQANRADSRGKE